MNLNRIRRGIVISALLSALVYALLAAFTDTRQVVSAIRDIPVSALIWMVVLTLICYLLRTVRWEYLMWLMGHPMGLRDSTYVQMSGMTMSVTPGKVGEVLKGFMTRELVGLPMARGVTLVFTERLTDVVAVVALSTGALGIFADTALGLGIAVVALVVGIALLTSHRVHAAALRLAGKQPWLAEHAEHAHAVSETLKTTLALRPLIISGIITAVAWSMEGLALWVCIDAMGFTGLSPIATVAVYSIATLIGAFTFLPGGIGLTEASMVGLLIAAGMASAEASAATLLIRVVTMWFGVGLGWVTMATRPALMRRLAGFDEDSSTPQQ